MGAVLRLPTSNLTNEEVKVINQQPVLKKVRLKGLDLVLTFSSSLQDITIKNLRLKREGRRRLLKRMVGKKLREIYRMFENKDPKTSVDSSPYDSLEELLEDLTTLVVITESFKQLEREGIEC